MWSTSNMSVLQVLYIGLGPMDQTRLCFILTILIDGRNDFSRLISINYCKTTIPLVLDAFRTSVYGPSTFWEFQRLQVCLLSRSEVIREELKNHFKVQKLSHVPVVLNWTINANLSSRVMESNSSHSTCQFASRSLSLGNMSSTFITWPRHVTCIP